MAKWAIGFGLGLIGLGLYGYFGHDPNNLAHSESAAGAAAGESAGEATEVTAGPSKTALIPAAVGLLLLICGTLALDPRFRKQAMHVAAGVALLAVLAGGGRLVSKVPDLMAGNFSRPTQFVIAMTVACLIYLIFSVRSFLAARRKPAV